MTTSEVIILSLSSLLVLVTITSFTRWNVWWIRVTDFPRLQFSTALIIMIIASLVFYSFTKTWHYIIVGLLVASLAYRLKRISQHLSREIPSVALASRSYLSFHTFYVNQDTTVETNRI